MILVDGLTDKKDKRDVKERHISAFTESHMEESKFPPELRERWNDIEAIITRNVSYGESIEAMSYAEAEEVSRRDLSPIDAADNVRSIKRMIAGSETWKGRATVAGISRRDRPAGMQTAAAEEPL